MADFEQLKASVASIIRTNGAEAITGAVLQDVLLTMINSISDGYMFGGVAQHSGSVGNPDYNVFYLGGSGSYTGYGGSIDVPAGSYCVFAYDGTWHQSVIDLGISLGGTVSEGETQGVTGDAVNTALNTLWENITNILDSIEFSDDTSELYKGDRITQGMRVTAGGVERLLSSFTILAATVQKAGLMSAADKRKLDNFVFTVQDMIETMTVSDVTGAGDTGTRIDESIEWTVDEVTHQIATFTLLAATAVKAGLMSNTDKQAVDALFTIEAEDTTAVDDLGVKLTETLNWTVNNVSQIFAEFTLLAATQSKAGLMSAADKAKLDAYENNIRSMEIVDTTGNADKGDQITETLRWVFGGVSTVITTFTLLAATHTKAGLMSAVDKQLVDALLTIIAQDTTAQADEKTSMIQSLKWTLGGTQKTMASFSILAATAEKAGLMSADDKAKLDAMFMGGYMFAGIATPSTTPVSTTSNIFYIATEDGTYFNAVTITQGINILSWDGTSWSAVQVVGIDDEPTKDSENLAKSGGILNKMTFHDTISPYDDPDVHSYFTDDENHVLVILYKDGSFKKFALTDEEQKIKDTVEMVSSDSPHDDADILKYITDENGYCAGYVKKNGTIFLYKLDADEIKYISEKSSYNDSNVLKYLTDENGSVFGYIEKDGTVYLNSARIGHLDTKGGGEGELSVTEGKLAAVLGLVATGVDNIEMSNNPKMMAVLNNLFTENNVTINTDNSNNVNLSPKISIIDDDTIDYQLPDSRGAEEPSEKYGGYFSLLLPITLSLAAKHGKACQIGLSCEGHRVGLTTLREDNDDYSALNTNGNAVKWIHDNMGWNVFNHSMTAQLPQHAYYVDGIDSELADTILTEGTYSSYLSLSNTVVIDRLTGKWYEVNSDLTAWVERTPTKKYAMPFYQDYITKKWYFNRDFDFDYSWGEWNRRATELGLPYEKVIVHNGGTASAWMVSAARKYSYFTVRTKGTHNYPPIAATVNRQSTAPSPSNGYNPWDDNWVSEMMDVLTACKESNSWVVLTTHYSTYNYRNYYETGRDYPSAEPGQPELRAKEDDYSEEWIIPLKYSEIVELINGEADYISTPPARLGISSWSEWHPAGGTHGASIYYLLDYAMSNGIDFVSPMDGWTTHGNILNLGVDRNGQTYGYDSASEQTPYTDEEKSYLTIGADMSIRYYNSKND